jgi:hypothetical protein
MFSPSTDTPLAVAYTLIDLLDILAKLWDGKTAFIEVFKPAVGVLNHLASKECTSNFGPELKVYHLFRFHKICPDSFLEKDPCYLQRSSVQTLTRQAISSTARITPLPAFAYCIQRA